MPQTDRARAVAQQLAVQNQQNRNQPNPTDKQAQSTHSSQNVQDDSSQALAMLIQQQVQQAVIPLQQEIRRLNEEKQAAAQAAADKAKEERQAQLDKDLETIMQEASGSQTGDDPFANMSNKQLVDVIASAVETAMGAQAEKIKSEIGQVTAPNNDKIGKLENTLVAILSKLSADETRAKFNDFDQYAPDIAKIMGEYPGLDYEKAYYIAKSEKAGSVPPQTQMYSEKPVDFATMPMQTNAGAVLPTQTMLQTIADRGRESRGDAPSAGTQGAAQGGVMGFRSLVQSAAARQAQSRQQ